MNFLRDRQIKKYCSFLTVFVFLLFAAGIWFHILQANAVKRLFIDHSSAVVSSLLNQGVPEDVIARAVTGISVSDAGAEFLNRLGMTEDTAVKFLPFIGGFQQDTLLPLLSVLFLLSTLLFFGAVLFFCRREMLFLDACQILDRFTKGDFSASLPQTEEGAVYQFFTSVNQLATILQSKNETQEKAKEFLKNTISDISHQLKTPLAALSMYHEIISEEPANTSTVIEYSRKTGQALSRMELLIQSMLKIARLDTGNIRFNKEPCLVTDLIARSVCDLTTRARAEEKEILLDGPPEESLMCDAAWTGEALGNLIKNALDHTNAGGKIRILWEHGPAMVRITVSDDGAGIAPEDIHHIFKRFYRSRHSLDTPGIGLGLPLTKSIVEGQGGIISVRSRPGEGTSFTLSFLTEL